MDTIVGPAPGARSVVKVLPDMWLLLSWPDNMTNGMFDVIDFEDDTLVKVQVVLHDKLVHFEQEAGASLGSLHEDREGRFLNSMFRQNRP